MKFIGYAVSILTVIVLGCIFNGYAVSVLWQSFLHDLFIAYILMDPERAMASIRSRLTQSIEGKFDCLDL